MSCVPLDPIPLHECGNHLVEDGETCDSTPGCIPPGTTNACHMECSFYPGSVCPKGQACTQGACLVSSNVCGNGITEPGNGETCDGGPGCIPQGSANACHLECGAGGTCPKGQACSQGACLIASNVCGNGITEPGNGETCDGDPGCIAADQPDGCHFACSSYPNGVCPAGSKCSAHGACLAALGVCGNGIVEAPEECDGDPSCIPAGSADECKVRCEAHSGGHCPAGSICDCEADASTCATLGTDACFVVAGVCGNLIVDPGEDCDGTPGCGPPHTSAACRFSCLNGATCPMGKSCDQDFICRTGLIHVGDITIAKAADVSLVSGVAILEGSLYVTAPDLTALDLPNLQVIRNDFIIDKSAVELVSASLPNLGTIGGNLDVCPNNAFDVLDLSNLTQAGGISFLGVRPSAVLCQPNLHGLPQPPFMPKLSQVSLQRLTTVGNFEVSGTAMPALPNMSPQSMGNFFIDSTSFTQLGNSTIAALSPTSIGDVTITNNVNLASIFITPPSTGTVIISGNKSLSSLDLRGLKDAASLTVSANALLSTFWLDHLHVKNDLTIDSCATLGQLDFSTCVVDGKFSVSASGGVFVSTPSGPTDITITNNAQLSSLGLWVSAPLQTLTVSGNAQLQDITDHFFTTYVRSIDIDTNAQLRTLSFPYLEVVQALQVTSNPALPTCQVQKLASGLRQTPPPSVTISGDNDTATCP
jgi:hypothetical protein